MKDGLQNPLWPFQVPGNALCPDQCTSHVLALHQQDLGGKAQYLCDGIP